MSITPSEIREQVRRTAAVLRSRCASLPCSTLVLGCSTSAVVGEPLGTAGNMDIAHAIVDTLAELTAECGLVLAVQGCEHVNRCLVVPVEYALERELTIVSILPELKAGGACATAYYEQLGERACVVEDLGRGAELGLDIGGVLIGMHLNRQRVAVPVRFDERVGRATVAGAFCRYKWVGGPRTRFLD